MAEFSARTEIVNVRKFNIGIKDFHVLDFILSWISDPNHRDNHGILS